MATALEYLKECPVCQEEYTDPRVFPCDHSLCLDCVGQIKKGNKIKCPECNAVHDVRQVRRDFRLMQFLDALKEEKISSRKQSEEPICDVCSSESASHWCNDCQPWLCKGCKKMHLRIAGTKNHTLEPVSRKIEDIIKNCAKELQSIKTAPEETSVTMKQIEDHLSELEGCQIEAIETSDKLRKKVIKDIEEYFDSIDGKILSFIQEKIAKLEKTREELQVKMHKTTSNLQTLEGMIQNNSRQLLTEGECILEKLKDTQRKHSPLGLDQEKVVIKVTKGASWDPDTAATLNMRTEINTQANLAKKSVLPASTSLTAVPPDSLSPPEPPQCASEMEPVSLSLLSNKRFKKTDEVTLCTSGMCLGLRVINNQLWSCQMRCIEIYDKTLKRIKKLHDLTWGMVSDVIEMPNVGIILACDDGLLQLTEAGIKIKQIDSRGFTSLDFNKNTIYASLSNDNISAICCYTYSDGIWVRQRNMKLPHMSFTTISVKADKITVCYPYSNIIDVLNMSGKMLHTHDFNENMIGDMYTKEGMTYLLCQEDSEGALLIADWENNQLQLLDKRRKWNIVDMEPAPQKPVKAVYFDDILYVQCRDRWDDAPVLYKYISH